MRRRGPGIINGSTKPGGPARVSEGPNGHTSQFMDADDAIEQEQIQQQLAQGVNVVSVIFNVLCHFAYIALFSILREMGRHTAREVCVGHRVEKTSCAPISASSRPRSLPQMVCLLLLLTSLATRVTAVAWRLRMNRTMTAISLAPGQYGVVLLHAQTLLL